jgi:hypothetical protein
MSCWEYVFGRDVCFANGNAGLEVEAIALLSRRWTLDQAITNYRSHNDAINLINLVHI